MNLEWQKILAAHCPEHEGIDLRHPGERGGLCPIISEVVLHVVGADAEMFLQAQFSNDISVLDVPGSQLTTWSSPKGRVITLLRVVKIADGFLLRLNAGLGESVLKRLRMYAMLPAAGGKAAEVTIEQRDDLLVAGISGAKAMEAAADASAVLPAVLPEKIDDTQALASGGWITRVRSDAIGQMPRYEIVADASQMDQLCGKCAQAGVTYAEAAWRLQNIDAGIPSIDTATSEAFVLQMLNLQHINGVSFKKGCFPGQEVVARMQYLGKLKRQMVRLEHVGSAVPKAGDEIFKADRDTAVGKVVDAVSVNENSCRLLAVMAIAELSEKLYLDKNQEHSISLLDLPYETPLAE